MSETAAPTMTDAAEMLWVVLANVSAGDWTKQSQDWQETAARWRDYYFAALNAAAPGHEVRRELTVFAGYLSAQLPELHQVEAGRMIECVEAVHRWA